MRAHHLIVGGQKSGKTRHAEGLALRWQRGGGRVQVLATAEAHDEEMRARIAHHQASRPAGFGTVEEPRALAAALRAHARADTLLLVDCLTLWLTNWLMPYVAAGGEPPSQAAWLQQRAALLQALEEIDSPIVLVSNEVGWGVSPLSREVRGFIDQLGLLNQDVARRCGHLTLMAAGQAFTQAVTPQEDLP
ncbi:bifunctional adenosylcobinamide kinase/adenosylcobinamide-phosphate guanylyltransferase [Roseateles sp. BYS180W]|uniref:Bifunctional adenosylcobalamin biosynthesis protein n=1 Tax=Roseateles rivi TaxID=3299028 RepID=A0ABW7FX75_9BURK